MKVLLVLPNLMYQMQLPNTLPLLAACLIEAGHEVKLFDTTLYETSDTNIGEMREARLQVMKLDLIEGMEIKKTDVFEDFRITANEYDPDVIGVSVVDATVELGLNLVKSLRSRTAVTIFGGKSAIFNPEELIKQEGVDIVCIGEGEKSLVELCNKLQDERPIAYIDNLWVKHGSTIYKNKLSAPVDLNTLPFEDYSIFEPQRLYSPMTGKMLKVLPINFDRGCMHKCTFCAAPTHLRMYKENGFIYYREKTIDRIHDEIKHQTDNHHVDFFSFNSETFLSMPLNKLKKFAEMYSEFNIPFWCQTRVDTITEDKVAVLASMNCRNVSMGIEHGNEEFRKKMLHKNITNEQIIKAFNIFSDYDITVGANNMLGFPDETRELVFDTIKLNRQIKSERTNGYVFQPYSGTPLRDYCIEKGYFKSGALNDIKCSMIGQTFLDMPQFTPAEIEGMLRTFVLYVGLPLEDYPKIKIAEQLNKEGDIMLEELKQKYVKRNFK